MPECYAEGFEGARWLCDPRSWPKPTGGRREGAGGDREVRDGELILTPPAKKDLWRRTYYKPLLIKDDASCLVRPLSGKTTVETCFTVFPKRQFDQGGIVVRLSSELWLKAGIEVVDGVPRIGAVCTNVVSDWSTTPWPSTSAALRVHVLEPDLVIEAAPCKDGKRTGDWAFLRICRLSHGDSQPWRDAVAGVYGACPEEQMGGKVVFHSLSYFRGSEFEHNADGNHEAKL
eukprot:TRINITY_DN1299_c0_g1_i1.p1 TRINITY_DN1299_c0_g1~~TRINITY_DN1299_c0_g1_i1.p1  ORF type:complete len:231 (+),score=79.74 TRINITY_DN1299_c0_g1_i1:64-756(+)